RTARCSSTGASPSAATCTATCSCSAATVKACWTTTTGRATSASASRCSTGFEEPKAHVLDDRPHRGGHGARRRGGDELRDPREEDRAQGRAPPRDRRPPVPPRDVGAAGSGDPARQ